MPPTHASSSRESGRKIEARRHSDTKKILCFKSAIGNQTVPSLTSINMSYRSITQRAYPTCGCIRFFQRVLCDFYCCYVSRGEFTCRYHKSGSWMEPVSANLVCLPFASWSLPAIMSGQHLSLTALWSLCQRVTPEAHTSSACINPFARQTISKSI